MVNVLDKTNFEQLTDIPILDLSVCHGLFQTLKISEERYHSLAARVYVRLNMTFCTYPNSPMTGRLPGFLLPHTQRSNSVSSPVKVSDLVAPLLIIH